VRQDDDVVGGKTQAHSIVDRSTRLAKDIGHRVAVGITSLILRPGAISPETFRRFYDHNRLIVLSRGFYAPVDLTGIDAPAELREYPGIDFQSDGQRQMLEEIFPCFHREYRSFSTEVDPNNPSHFYLGNGAFDNIDAFTYYGLIRYVKPAKIIEVGAGHSTLLASKALAENGSGQLIAVDPYPRPFLRGLSNLVLVEKRAEDVASQYYESLTRNDILFIDSSHSVRRNGDIEYLFRAVLPKLQEGVLVHIHDIYFPFDYPRELSEQRLVFWNEQYLLQALLANNLHVRVIFGSRFALHYYPGLVRDAFPSPYIAGGVSFWFQVC
jgi:hypothetical protein